MAQPPPLTPEQVAESLAEAQHYLDVQNYGAALPLFQRAADAGNATAMFMLGNLYHKDKNYGKAIEWYQNAADAGNKDAMYNLGYLYEDRYRNGVALDLDYEMAREWYKKAAAAGNTDAKKRLDRLRGK
jgi:TPR repeat protein